jgi:uncharacterized protein (DUF58 family)
MKKGIPFIKELFIRNRFFTSGFIMCMLFIAGFFYSPLFLLAKLVLLIFCILVLFDFYLLFLTNREIVSVTRELPEKFSNGDINEVELFIRNNHIFPVQAIIIDEIPVQFQIRNFELKLQLKPFEEKQNIYTLRPAQRGSYSFNRTLVYVSNPVGLLQRRLLFNTEPVNIPVYPSFLNIRKFEFLAISNKLTEAGLKRIRRTGHRTEFDQIREYVSGDDSRTINWKATAKKGKLMANQYQDERSQQIYNVIDMGRLMKMPFNGLSLMDYAINSSLILANTAIHKHDKAGLITFNTGIHTFIGAERRNNTLIRMLEALYNQETMFAESNYELLFVTIKKLIPQRSLIILYTNFETLTSLFRQMSFFQKISVNHLLLVVIFRNSEIEDFRKQAARNLQEIYSQTIAEKYIHDKFLITKELNKHGILSVLTRPEDLSVNLLNKYLELKERSLI